VAKTAIPNAQRGTIFMVEPMELTIIGLDTDDGPEHPLYDERIHLPLDLGLAANIGEHGVMHNVIVRKNGERLEVVAGRQRVRAARHINEQHAQSGLPLVRVPTAVRKPRSEGDALSMLVSENANRRSDDPITRAKYAQRLADFGHLPEEIALQFGCSASHIKNLLALLTLAPRVQKAVASEKLSYTVALTVLDLPHEEQAAKAGELIEAGAGIAEARRQQKARKEAARQGDSPKPERTRGKGVSVQVLRKIAATPEFVETLHPDARHLLDWILGDAEAAQKVQGLAPLLKSTP
jgi:ParB family transcriptional regulator, chromosome partitioning protein